MSVLTKGETRRAVEEAKAAARAKGPHPLDEDDFAAVCIDADSDKWMLFPVTSRDGSGQLLHTQTEGAKPMWEVSKGPTILAVEGSRFKDLDAVYDLCWREFDGLLSLRDTLRPMLSDIGPDA
jgi:hypothetical protein